MAEMKSPGDAVNPQSGANHLIALEPYTLDLSGVS
jgi:hypothetical protein